MSSTPSMVRALPATRWVVFGLLLLFSFVVLGVNANFIASLASAKDLVPPLFGFSVAVPVLTIVFIGLMLFIDLANRNAFTSMIVVELSVLGFFFVFWLAQAAWTTATYLLSQELCSGQGLAVNPAVSQVCTDFQVSLAFGWLSWIAVLAYFVMLLTISIIGAQKGASVWKSTVRNCGFGYNASSTVGSQISQTDAQFPVKFEDSQGYRQA